MATNLVQYVQNLEIDTVTPNALLEQAAQARRTAGFFDADKPSGFVVSGSTVSFIKLGEQARKDVLDSTLLAQLAANNKFKRLEQTQEWYTYYKSVLENIGWVLRGFSFVQYNSSSAGFTMDKVVIELLAAIATGGEMVAVEATLAVLRGLPENSDDITLFNTASYQYKAGNCQISVASRDQNGDTVMSLGAFLVKCNNNVTNFLFFTFKANDVDVHYNTQNIVLNEEVYSRVREAVVNKLGTTVHAYVKNLDISPPPQPSML